VSERKFENQVVVITGGSTGIGLSAAELFVDAGAKVVLVARDAAKLEGARKRLGAQVDTVKADVAIVDDVERVMAHVERMHGGIDVLFANAGMSECPPLRETDAAFFDQIMGVNLKGVFFSFVRAIPLFRQGASAVFTATATHARGRPGDPLYLASKAAVRSLARSLATDEEVLQKRVRVNIVSPGATETGLTEAAHGNAEVRAYVDGMVPLGRWGQPEEIARAVLFLASRDSAYITGAEIAVDGGLGQS
jgi:NAD(P)-dependent dehydrogenase (short-subunit alcohol dehydrogenase family)